MVRRILFSAVVSIIALGALAVAAQATIGFDSTNVLVSPDTGSAPVGGSHTVSALAHRGGCDCSSIAFHFEIVSGPNVGQSSDPNQCSPSCVVSFEQTTHWTYQDTGGRGTDDIEVCVQGRDGQGNPIGAQFCQDVSMTWVQGGGGFPGAIIPAAAQSAEKNIAKANAPAVAPAVSPPSTGTGIAVSPPNTGDAGLKHSSSSSTLFLIAGMAAFALAGLAGMRFARR